MRRAFLLLLMYFLVGPAPSVIAEDAAVRLLRGTVTSQRDGLHLPRLAALRQLRDPSLRPLFYQIVEHEQWQVQAHAVLGLAEINENRRVDPWLVTQVQPNAQEVIVSAALELDLIGDTEREQLLSQSDLAPMARLLLFAEPLRERGTHDGLQAKIGGLKDHEDDRVRVFARLLLAQTGDAEPFDAFFAQLQEQDASFQTRNLFRIIQIIHEYRLTAMAMWLDEQVHESGWPRELMQDAIIALLRVDQDRGAARWSEFLGESSSYAHRVRAAMLLLAAAPDIPPGLIEELDGDELLIKRLVGAARALAGRDDPSEAIVDLFRHGHRPSMEWVMNITADLPDPHAQAIYRAVIHDLDDPPIDEGVYSRYAMRAVAKMVEHNPGFVRDRLLAAERDSTAREAILLGLLESHDPRIGEMVQEIEFEGFRREDFLALLLYARHTSSLTPRQINLLSRVTSDRGRISGTHRVQSAWLQIKHSDRIEPTLTRIFADR